MQTQYRTMDEIRIHTTSAIASEPMVTRIVTQFDDGFTIMHGQGGWQESPGVVVTEHAATITVMSADRGNLSTIAKLVAGFAIHERGESEVWVRTSWSDDVMVFSA